MQSGQRSQAAAGSVGGGAFLSLTYPPLSCFVFLVVRLAVSFSCQDLLGLFRDFCFHSTILYFTPGLLHL